MHILHQEVLVQPFKGGSGSASAAGDDGCAEFAGEPCFGNTEEQSVHEGCQPAVGPAVINRGADDIEIDRQTSGK